MKRNILKSALLVCLLNLTCSHIGAAPLHYLLGCLGSRCGNLCECGGAGATASTKNVMAPAAPVVEELAVSAAHTQPPEIVMPPTRHSSSANSFFNASNKNARQYAEIEQRIMKLEDHAEQSFKCIQEILRSQEKIFEQLEKIFEQLSVNFNRQQPLSTTAPAASDPSAGPRPWGLQQPTQARTRADPRRESPGETMRQIMNQVYANRREDAAKQAAERQQAAAAQAQAAALRAEAAGA